MASDIDGDEFVSHYECQCGCRVNGAPSPNNGLIWGFTWTFWHEKQLILQCRMMSSVFAIQRVLFDGTTHRRCNSVLDINRGCNDGPVAVWCWSLGATQEDTALIINLKAALLAKTPADIDGDGSVMSQMSVLMQNMAPSPGPMVIGHLDLAQHCISHADRCAVCLLPFPTERRLTNGNGSAYITEVNDGPVCRWCGSRPATQEDTSFIITGRKLCFATPQDIDGDDFCAVTDVLGCCYAEG